MIEAQKQSAHHVLMVKPKVFFSNPETQYSNPYQTHGTAEPSLLLKKALYEQKMLIKALEEHGVAVTLLEGSPHCPDHIFPDWASTHQTEEGAGFILYPMHARNRRKEKTPEATHFLAQNYALLFDLSHYEEEALALESTASICLDRVHKNAYAALSSRTSEALAKLWAQKMGYKLYTFHTKSHVGEPIYHTDLVLWVGTKIAAICLEAVNQEEATNLKKVLSKTHQIVPFSAMQLQQFCGNMLEVCNQSGEQFLVMSSTAYAALTKAQKEVFNHFYKKLIYVPIPTIEKYGGGSVRCMVMELF